MTQEEINALAMEDDDDDEEEREAERRRIQAEIDELSGIQDGVDNQISELENEKSQLDECLATWNTAKTNYQSNENAYAVVVLNITEGNCADALKEKLSEGMTLMDGTYGNIVSLEGNIDSQISKLQAYSDELGREIDSLEAELASI